VILRDWAKGNSLLSLARKPGFHCGTVLQMACHQGVSCHSPSVCPGAYLPSSSATCIPHLPILSSKINGRGSAPSLQQLGGSLEFFGWIAALILEGHLVSLRFLSPTLSTYYVSGPGRVSGTQNEWGKERKTHQATMPMNLKKMCQVKEARHKWPHIVWGHLCQMSGKGKSTETAD